MPTQIFTLFKKSGFRRNFQVEKRTGTPYRTRSYLLGGAASGNLGGEEAGYPPVFLTRMAARNMLLF
jgi:hypothetical protein